MTNQRIILFLITIFLLLALAISSEQSRPIPLPSQSSVWTLLKSWFGHLNKIFQLDFRPEKCVNACGDGNCQTKFCIGKNCPCYESYLKCPADCGASPIMQPQPAPPKDSGNKNNICADKCGDSRCDEIVCLGTGCPCAETPSICPRDCKPR